MMTMAAEDFLARDAQIADWLLRLRAIQAETWNYYGEPRLDNTLNAALNRLQGMRRQMTEAMRRAEPVVAGQQSHGTPT